jgi:putative hemolysin
MDRTEFINAYRDELLGMVADAAMQARSGSELAVWLRQRNGWIHHKLGEIYDRLRDEMPSREALVSPSDRARIAVAPRGYVRPDPPKPALNGTVTNKRTSGP